MNQHLDRSTFAAALVVGAASVFALAVPPCLEGAPACIRIMEQDAALDNLVDPPGYRTAPPATLGGVVRKGTGPQAMILIPGLGFGADVFSEFMDAHLDKFRMEAVTLAGFGGTAAPASPAETVSFGEQTWTNGAVSAIEKLMADEHIDNAIVVGHWLGGTQVALRLALRHPEKIKGVILLAGAAKMMLTDPSKAVYFSTPEKRIASVDRFLAPKWFKTVTRETWDDNNFLPSDYAVDSVRGLRLWRRAAAPPLHVWVRYLCEFNAQDVSPDMAKLAVPTLLLTPGLEDIPHDPGQNYMELFCRKSWEGSVEKNPKIAVRTIPNSRACLWFDQPEAVNAAIDEFLKKPD